jgi:outer membrane protein OmpA-like peptidoglycan-associated protein
MDDDCAGDAEDADGFQDGDGCPEPDNDRDGVPDDRDECPDQPEEAGGDGDGCPSRTFVKILGTEIQIFGKVQFKSGSDEIEAKSGPLLDQIAAAMRSNPEVGKIRIEGHTDDTGDAGPNQRLSEARAAAVRRALVERDVEEGRLETKGYGESRPAAPNATAAGRAKNRRVEFLIVEGNR